MPFGDRELKALGNRLHARLLREGGTAAKQELAEQFLPLLAARLRRSFPNLGDPHLCQTAAIVMNRRVFTRSVSIVFVISMAMVLFCSVFYQSSASSALTFTEIGAAAGVAEANDGNGSSVADFDGDGLEDLIIKSWSTSPTESTVKLFHNNGNGTFTDMTNSWIDLSTVQAQAIQFSTWADFDNDGDLDCVLGTYIPAKLIFYRNDRIGLGTQTLTPIQTITEPIEFYLLAAWADYDNDGDLDLLSNRGHGPLLLLRNNLEESCSVSFTDVSIAAGIDQNARTADSLHWSDADSDGDVDLYVINNKNLTPYHSFYRNLLTETGSAFLQDEALAVGLPGSLFQATHAQFADYDDDGDMDIYFNLGFFTANLLFKNNLVETGVLSFTQQPNALGATSPIDGGYEIVWSEFDNDGDIDLLNGGGSNDPSFLYKNLLVETNTPGFADITSSAGVSGQEHKSAMFAFDLENDGDRDIFMGANGGGGNPHRLYRNNLTGSSWLSLNLVGTASNRDGIGARIKLKTGNHEQYRQHNIPGSWTTGIQSHRVHFGLGSANTVDEIEIRWPHGCMQTLTNVAANQIMTVVENCNNLAINCPDNITTGNQQGLCSAIVNYPTPTVSGNSPCVSINCVPSSGSAFPVGTTTVTCTVTDAPSNSANCSFTVTVVDNQPPAITCPSEIARLTDRGQCTAIVSYASTATDNCGIASVVCSPPSGAAFPIGTTAVNCAASDASGNTTTCAFAVYVTNPAPAATITSPPSGAIFSVDTPVDFLGVFLDNAGDIHTAQWTFDTISKAGTVNESNGEVSATHAFTSAGVYMVTLTISDQCGGTGTANVIDGLTAMVVVYDPDAGFLTGGGWINSPAGAYVSNPTLTGRASFGFVSKYQHGATVPTGNTEFQFRAANFNFHSSVYEWLVIAGARAQYKGSGTINGAGNYGFKLTAIDGQIGGGVDKFRIKIWDKNNGDHVVYDN